MLCLCRVPSGALSTDFGKGTHWISLCRVSACDTQHRSWSGGPLELLCRVLVPQTHDKGSVFVKCEWTHSAKSLSPSLSTVTVTFLYRVLAGTRQSLYRVPDIKYSSKRPLSMYSLPSRFYRVFLRLRHLANNFVPVVRGICLNVHMKNTAYKVIAQKYF
jgi:hypothetical protein